MEARPTTWSGCWRLVIGLRTRSSSKMDALRKEGRRILNVGLANGLKSLTERPPAITSGRPTA
jgi:hypothetical protein